MTALLIQLDTPVRVSTEHDLETDQIIILDIEDKPMLKELWANLQFITDPRTHGRLLLYQLDEYSDLGDWTYTTLCERVKSYYENGRSFPHYVSPNAVDPTLNQPEELPPPEDAPTGE